MLRGKYEVAVLRDTCTSFRSVYNASGAREIQFAVNVQDPTVGVLVATYQTRVTRTTMNHEQR